MQPRLIEHSGAGFGSGHGGFVDRASGAYGDGLGGGEWVNDAWRCDRGSGRGSNYHSAEGFGGPLFDDRAGWACLI